MPAQRTLCQLLRCIRKTVVILTLYSGTDYSTHWHNWQSNGQKFPLEYQRTHLLYYVRGIRHHKVESVTSNVSGTANQLLTTRLIAKIKSIAPVSSRRETDSDALGVMSIHITNKDKDCFIINWLHPIDTVSLRYWIDVSLSN